jgi:hypothetical protein
VKRCPSCKRFGVKYDPYTKKEKCIWKDCLWSNTKGIDLDAHDFGVNFKEFRDSITLKQGITA